MTITSNLNELNNIDFNTKDVYKIFVKDYSLFNTRLLILDKNKDNSSKSNIDLVTKGINKKTIVEIVRIDLKDGLIVNTNEKVYKNNDLIKKVLNKRRYEHV